MIEARNQTDLDWICTNRKHDWDFCGRGFGGERGWTTEGSYQRNAAIDQVGCKLRVIGHSRPPLNGIRPSDFGLWKSLQPSSLHKSAKVLMWLQPHYPERR